jgi:hypothetical protein
MRKMMVVMLIALGILALSLNITSALPPEPESPAQPASPWSRSDIPLIGAKPVIEVVFVLDTTGSMSGLIEGAKLKIWSIANEIIKAKPTPEIKIGLVGYRDKSDEYVTRVFDLSDNIDDVYKNLLSFKADGGGDTPEHVNKALEDAVRNIKWSQDKKALKIIYLVGDAPPHMEYDDAPVYQKTVESAVKNDIIINSVRCGSIPETEKFWQDIARLGEGKYTSINQEGGMVAVETPMDKELAELGMKLNDTAVGFGVRGRDEKRKLSDADELAEKAAPTASAARSEFIGKKGDIGTWDLVDAVRNKQVKLEDVKEADLPDEMKKMSLPERTEYLAKKEKEREELRAKIAELSKKRAEYIAEEFKKRGADNKNAFDVIMLQNLKEQAAKKGFRFEEEKK